MLLAIAAAPVAQADDDDTAYLVAIQSVSIPSNSPAMPTAYGRGLCARLAAVGFDPLGWRWTPRARDLGTVTAPA
jgi:hypothetical protein